MTFLLFLFLFLFLFSFSFHLFLVSGSSFTEFLYPNFTAYSFRFAPNVNRDFLFSRNGMFSTAMFNPGGDKKFYLCVIHVASSTVIWSANRDASVSDFGNMNLTPQGITITDDNGNPKWSTPVLRSNVYALQLTEMGNLVLLDRSNSSLWESFAHPTDTIVIGQKMPAGALLSAAVSDVDLSTGDYQFMVSESDAVMQWQGQRYWKLSVDARAFLNSNNAVEYMTVTTTGLFLLGQNGSSVIIQVALAPSEFRIAKMDSTGKFIISSFSGKEMEKELVSPADGCQLPFVCGRIGLQKTDDSSSNPTCSCPDGFIAASNNPGGCVPSDQGLSLAVSCNSSNNGSLSNSSHVSYLDLGYGISYFAMRFSDPIQDGIDLSACQDLCTKECSCVGIFHDNSSGSCYVLEKEFGSITFENTSENNLAGYIKAVIRARSKNSDRTTNAPYGKRSAYLIAVVLLLPFLGFSLLFVLCLLWRRRSSVPICNERVEKTVSQNSFSSGDLGSFNLPGLPKKFKYEELELATDNFNTQIGSGGFGAVYKGKLPDGSIVAVKKMMHLDACGNKECCTEIAVIGNILHANLVKLRGFCAQGSQLLLVYEYMNRGSLDKTLFGNGLVLQWQERYDIALGTARGLAYLHSGCDYKVIHCDVKPENILLHCNFQAKISDFGLSQLLSQDESIIFTTMRGTRGYLAPEWLTNTAISEKADVYSYGMVLLELVSGRKNCSFPSQSHSLDATGNDHIRRNKNHHSPSSSTPLVYFPIYALEMHGQGKYIELADPRLEGRVTNEDVKKLVCIALCCVHEEPALRPTMASVVGMLEGSIPIGEPRMESLNFLRFYGLGLAEASTIEGQNERNHEAAVMYRLANAYSHSTTKSAVSLASFSHISSQEVSGPR